MMTDAPPLGLKRMYTLLQRSRRLAPVVADSPTFLEISGYPQYESVCSNLLAFFFDPEGPHKLGPLFLAALLKEDKPNFGRVSVKREVRVSAEARIDLLIACDSRLVVIENKIFHEVRNPFEEYSAFADHQGEGRNLDKILLVLKEPNVAPGFGFRVLSYASFLEEVRRRLEAYSGEADARYRVLLFEFLNTMDKLPKVRSNMTPEHLKFFRETQGDLDKLLESVVQFKKELRNKVSELALLIDSTKYKNVDQSIWQEEKWVDCTLVHDIRLRDKAVVGVDAAVSAGGWTISVFLRRGGDMHQLKRLLKKLQIPFGIDERLTLPQRFGYDEPLTSVQAILQPVVDKIAGAAKLSA